MTSAWAPESAPRPPPHRFALDIDRRSRLLPGAGEPDERDEDAAALCPAEAITLTEGRERDAPG